MRLGTKHSEETRQLLRKTNKPPSQLGIIRSEENNKNHSMKMKARYAEMDDPGLEIIMHHYIYDFSDLNKYKIPVTRSEHLTIHNNLRTAGLEVPCINIMEGE